MHQIQLQLVLGALEGQDHLLDVGVGLLGVEDGEVEMVLGVVEGLVEKLEERLLVLLDGLTITQL